MILWIDSDHVHASTGFLVKHTGQRSYFMLMEGPARTNLSREPVLSGWCGSTNNVSVDARGVWRVVGTNTSGDRTKIAPLTDTERDAWLTAEGWDDLIPGGAL